MGDTQTQRSGMREGLKVWERLRIIVGEGSSAGVYTARIEDIINGGIIVDNPEFVTGNTLLRQGVDVLVQCTREDAVYQFHSTVRSQGRGNVKRVILTPPSRMQRVQRRLFARVELSSRVKYAEYHPAFDWNDWRERTPWYDSFLVDISGGGALFRAPEAVADGSLLLVEIELFHKSHLPEVVLCQSRRHARKEQDWLCGVEFILAADLKRHLNEGDIKRMPAELKQFSGRKQDALVTFLFQKQIELRQKGLI